MATNARPVFKEHAARASATSGFTIEQRRRILKARTPKRFAFTPTSPDGSQEASAPTLLTGEKIFVLEKKV
jgi:hypothetical protein